jgi:hypothetical protein
MTHGNYKYISVSGPVSFIMKTSFFWFAWCSLFINGMCVSLCRWGVMWITKMDRQKSLLCMHQAKRGIRENMYEPYSGAGSLYQNFAKIWQHICAFRVKKTTSHRIYQSKAFSASRAMGFSCSSLWFSVHNQILQDRNGNLSGQVLVLFRFCLRMCWVECPSSKYYLFV